MHVEAAKVSAWSMFDYVLSSRMSSGYAVLMDIFGEKIDFSHMPKGYKTPKLKNLNRLTARTSVLCMKEKIIANTV